MIIYRHVLSFWIFVAVSFPVFAQDPIENDFPLKDLEEEWLIYCQEKDLYLPYIENEHAGTGTIHFTLVPDEYRKNILMIHYENPLSVFINNELVDYLEGSGERIYPIDSLGRPYNSDTLFISLYSGYGMDKIETAILTRNRNVLLSDPAPYFSIKTLDRYRFFDFLKLAAIFILIIYAVIIHSGWRSFVSYYNIGDTFGRTSTDEFLNRTASLTRRDLSYLLVLSLVISFMALLIIYYRDDQLSYIDISSVFFPFLLWAILFLIIIVWYLLRFFLISVFSDLFFLRDIKTLHTFELIRATNFFSLFFFVFFIVLIFVFEVEFQFFGEIIAQLLLWFVFFRILVLYIKFLNSTSYKKLYLFTYLCISEVLPIITGVKFLLKSSLIQIIS